MEPNHKKKKVSLQNQLKALLSLLSHKSTWPYKKRGKKGKKNSQEIDRMIGFLKKDKDPIKKNRGILKIGRE